jgi:hypothetical protein
MDAIRAAYWPLLEGNPHQEPIVDLASVVPLIHLDEFASRVDWANADAFALKKGDISSLPDPARTAILSAAELPDVVAFAHARDLEPVVAVVAMMARSFRASSRQADFLAKRIFWSSDSDTIRVLMARLGLSDIGGRSS